MALVTAAVLDRLWVEKYRPGSFDDLDYHTDLNGKLKRIAASKAMPHLLIVGPNGAGRSTRVSALLRELYGPGVEKVQTLTRKVTPNPENPSDTVGVEVTVSNYHLSVATSELGNKDRAVVMQLIKEQAMHPPLGGHTFKVVVIEDAGSLSQEAQAALRRTMERFMKTCRIVLITDTAAKIIPPLRSRCLSVRVPAPSQEEVCAVLQKVAGQEGVTLAPELATRIAVQADRDMRQAILLLEAARGKAGTPTLPADFQLSEMAFEGCISRIASKIQNSRTKHMAMTVRFNVSDLMNSGLQPVFILKALVAKLLEGPLDEDQKERLIHDAAFFESSMKSSSKAPFHIEAFVLRFMACYNVPPPTS